MQENAIVKASISKQIAEQLRAAIVDGQFKIGERLPTEDELAKRYGVSRPSVREALAASMEELLDFLLQKFEQASPTLR